MFRFCFLSRIGLRLMSSANCQVHCTFMQACKGDDSYDVNTLLLSCFTVVFSCDSLLIIGRITVNIAVKKL